MRLRRSSLIHSRLVFMKALSRIMTIPLLLQQAALHWHHFGMCHLQAGRVVSGLISFSLVQLEPLPPQLLMARSTVFRRLLFMTLAEKLFCSYLVMNG